MGALFLINGSFNIEITLLLILHNQQTAQTLSLRGDLDLGTGLIWYELLPGAL